MLIEYKDVNIYQKNHLIIENANFHVDNGEFIYLTGKVGSGKSSILKTIYADIPVIDGQAEVLEFQLNSIRRKNIPYLRRQLGIVFQDFQLLTDRTVGKNLEFVLKATGWEKRADIEARIKDVLNAVDMAGMIDKFPHELSGGEQQRISIARAILNRPKVILADEPTGNLDKEAGQKIVSLLHSICEKGTAVIMSTHNLDLLHSFPGIVYRCENQKLLEVTNEYDMPLLLDDKTEEEDNLALHMNEEEDEDYNEAEEYENISNE